METIKRKCKVVMLATNEKTNIINTNQGLLYNSNDYIGINQHLYIISDDEIKKGDWVLADVRYNISENSGNSIYNLFQCIHINNGWIFVEKTGEVFNQSRCKKIIATTIKLPTEPYQGHFEGIDCTNYLPYPSKGFIQKYIEEYNKGNKITKVMVEYLYTITNEDFSKNPVELTVQYELKTDSKNQINISKIKETWTKEEVVNIIEKLRFFMNESQRSIYDVNEWIEKNLN